MRKRKLIAALLAMAVSVPMFTFNVSAADYLTLYVATDGSDSGTGTIDSPFATIERARDEIRNIKKTSGLPSGGACVYVREGVYQIFDTIEFTEEDSGTKDSPITYRAYHNEKVELVGGVYLEPAKFKIVSDKAVLDKLLDQSVAGKLLEYDMSTLGLKEIPEVKSYGAYQSSVKVDRGSMEASMEFFVGGNVQTVSRYPNEGDLTYDYKDVISFPGTRQAYTDPKCNPDQPFQLALTNSRFEVWAKSPTAKLYGYWDLDWADYTLKIKSYEPGKLTLSTNVYQPTNGRRFYGYDIFEEIDRKGEYYIDREAKKLYWYPTDGFRTAEMALSTMLDPLFEVSGSYINLKNFDMGYSRGSLISITGDYNTVSDCELYYTGAHAVKASGKYNGIVSNYIHDVDGGIVLEGGDAPSLTQGQNYAENNYVKNFARLTQTYMEAIRVYGVGQRVTNNTMTGSTHLAMQTGGPQHIIEYNDIFDVLSEADDAGAVYSGRNKTFVDTVVRYNYIHDMGSDSGGAEGIIGLYFDDGRDAQHVYGNVFANYTGFGIQATGSDSIYENNLAYNIGNIVRCVDWSTRRTDMEMHRSKLIEGGSHYYAVSEKIWLEKYPQIAKKLDMENMFVPINNVIKSNLIISAGDTQYGNGWANSENGNIVEKSVGGTKDDIEITEDGIRTLNDRKVYQSLGEDFPQIDTSLTGVYAKKFREKFDGRIVLGINKGGALSDNKPMVIDETNDLVMPFIDNGRTMVPIRFISENLGAKVDWNQEQKKATITGEGVVLELVLGESQITVNGEKKDLDAPAVLSGGRTFVPIRVISENLGKSVHWDEKGLIVISDADKEFKADEYFAEYEGRLIDEALRKIDLR